MIGDGFRLLPHQASTFAPHVDLLYFALLGLATFFTILISSLILFFCIKYRRGNQRVDRVIGNQGSLLLEITWTVIPAIISVGIFTWGAALYFRSSVAPVNATEITVVAKQWMWKFQHGTGQREINTLHVPLGQPFKLNMISEDVIHSLYVPAFRIKNDVLPGRYRSCWFEASQLGEFHLFCAEYCGTNHSRMVGKVVVMEPSEFEKWLSGRRIDDQTPVLAGQSLFEELRCATCHRSDREVGRGPPLVGLAGHEVKLNDGSTVIADENYLRESIVRPMAKIVAGYPPLMPSYDGQLTEEKLIQLVSYLQSLTTP